MRHLLQQRGSGMGTDCAVMPSMESTGRRTTESGASGGAERNQHHRELPDLACRTRFRATSGAPFRRLALSSANALRRHAAGEHTQFWQAARCVSTRAITRLIPAVLFTRSLASVDEVLYRQHRRIAAAIALHAHREHRHEPAAGKRSKTSVRLRSTDSESQGQDRETDGAPGTLRQAPVPRRFRGLRPCRTS